MSPSVKRTQRDYSLAFKLALVDQVEKGELTYKQAQDRYGIQGRSTVLSWLRKHGRLDWSLGTPTFACLGGIQYCSAQYQVLHDKYGVRCSMTDGYDCYQNALAERVNGILKHEYLIRKPRDILEAKQMVAESINTYNQRRPHLSLQYKTPDEVHRAFT